ncbi:MAG: phytoene desaturase family protein [bacterium]
MARDNLKDTEYDVIVIGGGLAGLTGANMLAKFGRSVLLLEHHHKLGGLATWFRRPGGHIFDISLHGFPVGMIKTCRRYWTQEIADCIVQLKGIRFDNPQFSFTTTFDRADFTNILTERFHIPRATVDDFFTTVKKMNFYDDQTTTTRELFEKFFPGRKDVVRLLMEPITYANGSGLDEPAITYGIVFSNFMSKGVYIFRGGTDRLIKMMKEEMLKNGVEIRTGARVEKIAVNNGKIAGVIANGKEIKARAVLSNANLNNTIFKMTGKEHFPGDFLEEAGKVRMNNSSCQVYIGIRSGETIDYIGDLLFTSTCPEFDYKAICSKNITSRTFSLYYPDIRPGGNRYAIVSSTNANYHDWAHLSEEEYYRDKEILIEDTLNALERYIPGVRDKIDFTEASTPKTFERYTLHQNGASFGTKFEGLKISADLPKALPGLYHAGSVGIIMSGWLGAVNYGVICSNDVDKYLN